MWKYLPSKEFPLSCKCKYTAESCPEEVVLQCFTPVKLFGFSFVLVQGLLTALLSLFFPGFGMNQFLSEGFAGTEGHQHVMLGQTIILCFSVKVRSFLRILWITWEQGGIVFWNQYHRWIYYRRLRGRAGGCQYLFPCLLADLMKAQFGLPHVLSALLMCVCSFSFLSALKGTFSAWWCLCSSGWWDSKSRYWCVCVGYQ